MRSIDVLINICEVLSNNGNIIRNESELIDFIYELKQKDIKFPSYNWTFSYGGITSPELKNDIKKLKFFKIIEEQNDKIIIVEKNKKRVEKILKELNQEDREKLNSTIHSIKHI